MNSKKTSTNKLPRMINFYTISHDTGIASKLRSKSSNNGKKGYPEGDCTMNYLGSYQTMIMKY